MTRNRFAVVSEWMTNGNINQFVAEHLDVNRFELVSSLFKLPWSSLVVDGHVDSVVGGRRKGLALYAQPGGGPRGPQGGASLGVVVTPFSLTTFMLGQNLG